MPSLWLTVELLPALLTLSAIGGRQRTHGRCAAETSNYIRKFTRGYVVIHHYLLSVPFHLGCDAVTLVKIGVCQFFAACTIRSVDSKTIKGIAKQCRLTHGIIFDAGAEIMIVIVSALLWMTAALILHFVRGCVTAFCIERAEDQNAREHDANLSAHASWLRGHSWIGRNTKVDRLRFDRIGILI